MGVEVVIDYSGDILEVKEEGVESGMLSSVLGIFEWGGCLDGC